MHDSDADSVSSSLARLWLTVNASVTSMGEFNLQLQVHAWCSG